MRLTSTLATVALLAAGVALVQAEPTTKPAKEKKEMHGPRLIKPYSELTTLTPEEKEKIASIHKKVIENEKVMEDKEASDIEAILTDDQKAELAKIKEEERAKVKGKEAEKKHATTEPSSHGG